jgi:hypothetical protein
MKSTTTRTAFLAVSLIGFVYAGRANSACCALPPAENTSNAEPAAAPAPAAPVGHPLRGVIIEVLPEKSSLLIAHEEIPGVMRAMTMLLKVNASDLAAAPKGVTITATLVKKTDGWWLESVAPVIGSEK